jgi:ribosome biogenesis GTPase
VSACSHPAATVVAAHGRRGVVEVDGTRRAYLVKGRRLRVVCGDRVICEQPPGSEELLVTAIAPRKNALARSAERDGEEEILAANLTQVVAVCASRPEPDLFLLDRYLCAVELMGCRAALAWNKADLGLPPPPALAAYRDLGYPVITLSAHSSAGLPALQALLAGNTSVLVGQSGVGKSSLINALAPGAQATIGELSAAGLTGTHTTTASLMYALDGGGRLIDTPGVRDFVPALGTQRLDRGFPEIARLAASCRFADCSHRHEPGCAVKSALAAGGIPARRYASYERLSEAVGERAAKSRDW